MQMTLSTGLLKESPGAVPKTMIMSELSNFSSKIISIFIDRKFVSCSGPPAM